MHSASHIFHADRKLYEAVKIARKLPNLRNVDNGSEKLNELCAGIYEAAKETRTEQAIRPLNIELLARMADTEPRKFEEWSTVVEHLAYKQTPFQSV